MVGADARVWTRPLYYVRAVTEGNSLTSAFTIAHRIDEALMGKSGSITVGGATYTIAGVFREESRSLTPEIEPGGPRINHVGGEYRFICYQTS